MLYWLSAFSDTIGPLNVLRYITFRTGGAMITALTFVFLFGPWIIDHLVALVGGDLALAALALAELQPASGRGSRMSLDVPGGAVLLIDESYNANPASMRAALDLLGHAEVGARGRRIAVLGDMLELGPRGAELHGALAEAVVANRADLVFCCGPLMRALWEALPSACQGGYADTSAALESQVLAAIQPGDTVMVKGSLGSRMAPIVKALASRYRRATVSAQA